MTELFCGQDKVDDAGCNGAAGHGGVFGLLWVLHQNDAAGLLHRANADGAVRSRSAQDDRKTVTQAFGKRTKEHVDRRSLSPRLIELHRRNLMINQLESPIGWNDIN